QQRRPPDRAQCQDAALFAECGPMFRQAPGEDRASEVIPPGHDLDVGVRDDMRRPWRVHLDGRGRGGLVNAVLARIPEGVGRDAVDEDGEAHLRIAAVKNGLWRGRGAAHGASLMNSASTVTVPFGRRTTRSSRMSRTLWIAR